MGFIIIVSCLLLAIFSIRKYKLFFCFLYVYLGQLGLKWVLSHTSENHTTRPLSVDLPAIHILQIKIVTFSLV